MFCNFRCRFQKILVFGLVLQIVFFFMYMSVFHSEHDITNRTPLMLPGVHFTRDILQGAGTSNRSQTKTNCNNGDNSCLNHVEETFGTVISSCKISVFPANLLRRNAWQNIDDGRNGYVFSAYFDKNIVKVVGITSAKLGPVTCQLWYKNDSTVTIEMVEVDGGVSAIPEGHGKRFTAAFFTCRLPTERIAGPFAVSIAKEKCKAVTNLLRVTDSKQISGDNRKFSVCVTPFNFRYGRAYELIEWIELNRILGADHFVFYNYSVAPNVEQVLQSYIKQGVIDVVDWKLPVGVATWPPSKTREEIHYFGQLASLNECLLRVRGNSRYLVNLDVDEFIIPRKKEVKNWTDMLSLQPSAGGYLIANVFFRKEWNTSVTNYTRNDLAVRYKLVTLLKLQHEKTVYNFKTRSKYIVDPNAVDVLGIHNIWKNGGRIINVPHDIALLHHYRNWMKYGGKEAKLDDNTIVDKFKDILIDNVVKQWDNLPGVLMDIPLCDNPKDFGGC